jgi:hypothetical protein
MIIREEQMQVMADEDFARYMCNVLREKFSSQIPQETDDDALKENVREGIKGARRHELTWRSTIGAFVILYVTKGRDFDQRPEVKEALSDPAFPPDERMKKLVKKGKY